MAFFTAQNSPAWCLDTLFVYLPSGRYIFLPQHFSTFYSFYGVQKVRNLLFSCLNFATFLSLFCHFLFTQLRIILSIIVLFLSCQKTIKVELFLNLFYYFQFQVFSGFLVLFLCSFSPFYSVGVLLFYCSFFAFL